MPFDLRKIASTVLTLRAVTEYQCVEVGQGARDITRYWPPTIEATKQCVCTVTDTRNRDDRIVRAEPLLYTGTGRYFIDDVAVSGATLEAARSSTRPDERDEALVGMMFASRRLIKRIDMPISAAITYKQAGGGKPAINSISTIAKRPDLRADYARNKFNDADALERIVKIYREEEL